MTFKTLAELPTYTEGCITAMNIDGEMRRRLMDLGFSSGNTVIPLFKSPFGDPVAYYIMGSIVALRNDEADKIRIDTHEGGDL